MRSTTSAPPRYPADTTSEPNDRKSTTAPAGVSLPRLYFLRLGFLVVAVGLAVTIVAAVIPWRYVVAHYVTKQGDPWRKTPG